MPACSLVNLANRRQGDNKICNLAGYGYSKASKTKDLSPWFWRLN